MRSNSTVLRHSASIAALIVTLGTFCGRPTGAWAGPILQDFSNEARNIFPFVGQTFTAEDPFISVAGVYVVDFTIGTVATDSTIEYRLYQGIDTSGPLLGTRIFSTLTEGFDGFADVSFAGIPLVVGAPYLLYVTNDTTRWGVESAFNSGGTFYVGGNAFLPPSGDPGVPPRDLRFHVLPQVPEPGTLVLVGSAIAAAAVSRRLRKSARPAGRVRAAAAAR